MNVSTRISPSRNQQAPLLIDEPIARALDYVRSAEPQYRVLQPLEQALIAEKLIIETRVSQHSEPNVKKKVRSKVENLRVPPKLLLSPNFRAVPTILTAPKDMNGASRQLKAAFRAAGALYQLASPPAPSLQDLAPLPEKRHTWFIHDRDILYYPCPVNNNKDSLYKRAQYVLMDDIRYYSPRSLSKVMVPLVNPAFFPSLKSIYLSSGLIYANSSMWTPNATRQFFGSEYALLVDLLNPAEVLNMRIKLRDLNLLDETENNSSWICDTVKEKHGRFSWLCEEFDDTAARFLQPAYWQELKESFQDAWLSAKWRPTFTKISWSNHSNAEQIVPTAWIEDPNTRHHFVGAVRFRDEIQLPPTDAKGRWFKGTSDVGSVLTAMPPVRPVFVFVLPEDMDYTWESNGRTMPLDADILKMAKGDAGR